MFRSTTSSDHPTIRRALRAGVLASCALATSAGVAAAQAPAPAPPPGAPAPAPAPTTTVYRGAGAGDVVVDGTSEAERLTVTVVQVNGTSRLRVYDRDRKPVKGTNGCVNTRYAYDVICALPKRLVMRMNDGNDVVGVVGAVRNTGRVEVWGGAGNDELQANAGTQPALLLGGDGDDKIVGSAMQEALFGGPGNDVIRPGGGPDHIDGGHGAFGSYGPILRAWYRNDGECAAHTHGFFDRLADDSASEGVDRLELSTLTRGALVDLGQCRMTYRGSGTTALVHGIEDILGSAYDDVLLGDAEANAIAGGRGRDLLAGGAGDDRIGSVDGAVDTIRCGPGQDAYVTDAFDRREGCGDDDRGRS